MLPVFGCTIVTVLLTATNYKLSLLVLGASLESVIGHIDPLVAPFLSGKMEITGHIYNAAGAETICFQFQVELKKP